MEIRCENKKVQNVSKLMEKREQCGHWEGTPVLERTHDYKESYNIQPTPTAIYFSDYDSTTFF